MNKKHLARIVLPLILLLALTGTAMAGNWAIITLSDIPDYTFAGAPLKLTFTVRQHGKTLLSNLHPTIQATTPAGASAKFNAVAGSNPGDYSVTLNLPQPGEWTVKVVSGFFDSTLTLPMLKVIAANSAAPAPFSPNTRGLRLFAAKGCVGCHRHVEVNPERVTEAKMDLSGKRFPQEYLRKFLADPSIKPAEMPNLKLTNNEIEALAAFINKLATKTRG